MNTIKLKDILSISGKGGLYRYIAQSRNGIVVESIDDKKRHVAQATARVSSLDDIAIFTHDEEVSLADIFYMIHEKAAGKETLSHKSNVKELNSYFKELVPDYDEERVYMSDIKKVFQWYNQLHSHNLLEVVEKEEEGSTEDHESKSKSSERGSDGFKKSAAVKTKDGAAKSKTAVSGAKQTAMNKKSRTDAK